MRGKTLQGFFLWLFRTQAPQNRKIEAIEASSTKSPRFSLSLLRWEPRRQCITAPARSDGPLPQAMSAKRLTTHPKARDGCHRQATVSIPAPAPWASSLIAPSGVVPYLEPAARADCSYRPLRSLNASEPHLLVRIRPGTQFFLRPNERKVFARRDMKGYNSYKANLSP